MSEITTIGLDLAKHVPSPQSLTQNRRTLRINTVNLKTCLARSRPIVVISLMDGSLSW